MKIAENQCKLNAMVLASKGYFKRTYTTDMAAYFVSVTASPCAHATKPIKAHRKAYKKKV